MKITGIEGMRQEVWHYLVISQKEKPLVIWGRWGTEMAEVVDDTIRTLGMSHEVARIDNDDERADFDSLYRKALSYEGRPVIVTSVMPETNAEETIGLWGKAFHDIRYEVSADEWLEENKGRINKSIWKFIRRNPHFLMMLEGKQPVPNCAGPSPLAWKRISDSWERDIHPIIEWHRLSPFRKVRRMMLDVYGEIGKFEPLFSKLATYLLETRAYDRIRSKANQRPYGKTEPDDKAKPDTGRANNFSYVFNEDGTPAWK